MSVSAAEFLDAVYANATPGGYVTISGYRLNGDNSYKLDADGALIWTDKVAVVAVDELNSLTVEPLDRWFTVHPRIEPKRGAAVNTAEVLALPIDFDFADSSDGKDPARSFTSVVGVRRFCNQYLPIPPSALVESGHGVHAYWFLTDPVGPEDGEQLLANFDSYVRDQAASIGKDLDAVRDLARVLRLPDSVNLKDPDNPRPVTVAELHQGRRYSVEDFGFCPDVPISGINPDTSDITDEAVTAWIEALPAGKVDAERISHYVDTMRGAVPGSDKKGRRPTGMMVLGWLTTDAEVGRVDFRAAIAAVEDEFVAMFTNKKAARTEFAKMTVRTIKYRIAEPPAKLTHKGIVLQPVQADTTDIPTMDGLPITAYRSSDLDALADVPIEFLIRGLLIGDTAGMWGGAQKTLKTELQIALDLSVASGVPFLRHPEFAVEKTGPVLTFVGEGGLAPYMRRVRRVAAAYGIKNPDDYVISGHLGDMSSDEFIRQVADTVEAVDPVLVRIDPYYAYHGGDTEAGNLFAQGKLLTRFQTAVAGRAFLLTHHFNEGGRGLDLARFTQAGSAQWIDSWVQVVHRETPNSDEGTFWLGLKVGSRQWGERLYEVDVNLGTFDMDGGHHNGVPTWEVRQVDYSAIEEWGRGSRPPAQDNRPEIAKILRDEPWQHTRTEVIKTVGGTEKTTRLHLDELIGARIVVACDVPAVNSAGRRYKRKVLGFAPETIEIYGIGIPIDYPESPEEAQ